MPIVAITSGLNNIIYILIHLLIYNLYKYLIKIKGFWGFGVLGFWGYFATEVLKNPSLYTKFSLSDRVYLGPTTTDHELAILMANQALVTNKTMVYDPFCGTCGILLICSYFG